MGFRVADSIKFFAFGFFISTVFFFVFFTPNSQKNTQPRAESGYSADAPESLIIVKQSENNDCQNNVDKQVDEKNVTKTVLDFCNDVAARKYFEQRGVFYVLYNFVQAERSFKCGESITLTSPGDYRFLDNVIPLVERWRGPISVALYAPGEDFFRTTKSIAYLRQCQTALIRELVTFHVFFETGHVPNGTITPLLNAYEDSYDCSVAPPWETFPEDNMYKAEHNLLYPINTARNIARVAAQTYFVFPSDIELYPTLNFVEKFFELVRRKPELFEAEKNNVFVLPVFEVLEGQKVPSDKKELQQMLTNKTAILFHKTVCSVCHRIPNDTLWIESRETGALDVFAVGKRVDRYRVWEPFYVGTQREPLWDERLTWEGQGNKMIQAYNLCLLDYNFMVLNEAFLIHKPGVKKKKVQNIKYKTQKVYTNRLVKDISLELQQIYGFNDRCTVNSWN